MTSAERMRGLRRSTRPNAVIAEGSGEATRTFELRSPIDGGILADVADCGLGEALSAVSAASGVFNTWRVASPFERATLLQRWHEAVTANAEKIAELTVLESGKPLREARAEVASAAQSVKWAAEEATRIYGETIPSRIPGKQLWTELQGMGIVYAITPWNFPTAMITRKVAPAIAAGCPVILKPAEETPLTALLLGELWLEVGGPPGGMQVLPTNDPEALTDVLLNDARVRKVTFTGSTAVGARLLAKCSANLQRISLELGGSAPFIVFPDADLERAVTGLMSTKFKNAGQTCISTNRVLVHRSIVEEFSAAVRAAVDGLVQGDPFDEHTDIGPMINEQGVKKVLSQIGDAVKRGARVVVGGDADGLWMAPSVVTGVSTEMQLFTNETFGPVVAITTFDDATEVFRLANSTTYGLAAYVWTGSVQTAHKAARALDFGLIGINDASVVQTQAPFGGLKGSGVGKEGGKWGVRQYLDTKYVSLDFGADQL